VKRVLVNSQAGSMISSLVLQLGAFTVFFAICTYVCIVADPDESPAARFFVGTIPSLIYSGVEHLFGKRIISKIEKFLDRSLQIAYLIVVLGSWSIVFAYGYPAIKKSRYISTNHQYAGYIVFIMCMSSWHYACQKSPGHITNRTLPLFDHYQYDDLLYTNRLCPTTKIRKLARSKYDRFSKKHVPRFDHFCGWLNQAIGEQNYRWFLLFLMVHVFMCFYGSWALGRVLYGEVLEKNLLNATFFNAVTGAEVKADYFIIFHYLFMKYFQICGVFILMSVMSVVLGVFLMFHLYITSRNMTTNEFFKWQSFRRLHRKEKYKFEKAQAEGKISSDNGIGSKVESVSKQLSDVDIGCTGPMVAGPVQEGIQEDETIDPGLLPGNIYDNGIILNFYEIIFPLSYRGEAIERFNLSLNGGYGESNDEQNDHVHDHRPKPKSI